MNILKKIVAAVLAIMVVLSLAGCHKKNEVAVTIGEWEFTSAYYMCALIAADLEAQQEVNDLVVSGKLSSDVDVTKDDYRFKAKIHGKEYETWVREKAIDTLKNVAVYKNFCKKNKLEISKKDKEGMAQIVAQQWMNNGAMYIENGVSYATFEQFLSDDYYSEIYFGFLYEEGGEKEVPAEDIKAYLNENYILANVIGENLANLDDTQKTAKKEMINRYYDAIVKGEQTFEQIYKKHNEIEDKTESATESDNHEHEEENQKPKDIYASLINKENGGDHFKSIVEMKTGDVKILNGKDDLDIVLVVKKDINEDPYYLKDLDTTIRHALKDEEFEKEISKAKKTLKVDENTYATKRFKLKKIKYPVAQA